MHSNDLRGVADGIRLLALVELRFQLISAEVQTEVLLLRELRPRIVGENLKKKANLLCGAVWMVKVDSDRTLTSTEGVHSEFSGAPHSVPCPFNTCSRKNITRQRSKLYQSIL